MVQSLQSDLRGISKETSDVIWLRLQYGAGVGVGEMGGSGGGVGCCWKREETFTELGMAVVGPVEEIIRGRLAFP